ncbi:opposite strand transcription unit to Stag3-like protein [Camelus ferus]|nr:opposite strand transcription unit to Stag3-like protein [Camelus ferus]
MEERTSAVSRGQIRRVIDMVYFWSVPHRREGTGSQCHICLPSRGSLPREYLLVAIWCKFFSLTETPEDYTIIVDEEGFLELPSSEHLSVADATWLALNVVSGGGSFSSSQPIGVTKIAKSVIAPLADQNISVFMLSTYQTDFILVRERDLPFVTHTLSSEFTILRVVNGETVAAENLGITNGFVKPKMAPDVCALAVQRPVIHPLSSPSNRFCVTSLDPDTLPAVATLLMDVMFYSNGVKDPMAAGDDCGHIRFFSFSLIEGYISLVMDVQTQQSPPSRAGERFPSNLLFTSASGELWKMVRIGGQPLGFDECGIVAQISEPLAAADIPAYYISTFKFDHALVPEENINGVISALKVSQAEKH